MEIRIIENLNGQNQMLTPAEQQFVKDRVIYLVGEVTDALAVQVNSQLRYLNNRSNDDITLIINSPGGSVTAGMAIHDVMNAIESDVCTVCEGMAASMGAFLLAAGAQSKRKAYPNAEVMIHQPLLGGGISGQATDIALTAEHILRTKSKINRILAQNTGKTETEIASDTERDNWFTADEALEYGLIDEIITKE